MTQVKYDNQDQYNRVRHYIISGETLQAVFDCKGGGTGFVGITDQRIIFYDQGFLTKKKAMVSIPYHHIIGVASADEGVIFKTSELTIITSAGKFTFEFRGSDKAHWAYTYLLNQILNQANPQLRDRKIRRIDPEVQKTRNESAEEFKDFCLICQKSTLQYRDADDKIRCKNCDQVVPSKI